MPRTYLHDRINEERHNANCVERHYETHRTLFLLSLMSTSATQWRSHTRNRTRLKKKFLFLISNIFIIKKSNSSQRCQSIGQSDEIAKSKWAIESSSQTEIIEFKSETFYSNPLINFPIHTFLLRFSHFRSIENYP